MFKLLSALFFVSLISACASGVSNSVKVTEDDMAKFNVMTPEEAVSSLEKSLQEARDAELPFYTPSFYKEANTLYENAKKNTAKKKPKESIIRDVAKADRLLAKAKIKKREVESELSDLFQVNKNLVELKAPTVYKSEYNNIRNSLTDIIEKVENNKADKIDKDKSNLLKKFVALEVKIIKYTALNEANNIKKKAKAKNALKLAPKTYANAVTVYQQSEANISETPHDKEKVAEAKRKAMFAANHALIVTERVIKLQKDFKKSPEAIIIEEDNRILSVSQALDKSDLRDKAVDDQISTLVDTASKLNGDSESNLKNAEKITDLENQLKEKDVTIASTNQELEKAKAELLDRNNQLVKMTADLVQLQNKEKLASTTINKPEVIDAEPAAKDVAASVVTSALEQSSPQESSEDTTSDSESTEVSTTASTSE